ncbi:hypothetical protein F4821DRAFT_258356 [Hypoxylon rubiginosum]|uniref:Uncharacterized protein n=1 Tax=Hypoxylon rubiginosum TaxID=110542 RepID=A0ACC0D614_9PEZI|nr:hypothetical protein F4821DRAFT_258356 [Hypoxylon rubiginosum]
MFTARTVAGNYQVAPALDSVQMDNFIEERCPLELLSKIPINDQQIIKQAWKFAYWLSVLSNWDNNKIYCDGFTTLGIQKSAVLKNLVLELMYSIVYQVQELIQALLKNVIRSLEPQADPLYDPWTTSYALLIVYNAIKKSKLLKWEIKNLDALDALNIFLGTLHSSSAGALRALVQYRRAAAFRCCGQSSQYKKVFDQLLAQTKIHHKPTIAFSFEQAPEIIGAFNLPTNYPYTYTGILISQLETMDNGLFSRQTVNDPNDQQDQFWV